MASKLTDKIIENKFKNHLAKLIYSAIGDIEKNWNNPTEDMSKYHNYNTIGLGKKDAKKLTSRFTIGDPVRQYMTFITNTICEELNNAELTGKETIEEICEKTSTANEECYVAFMIPIIEFTKDKIGDILNTAGDPTHWFRTVFVDKLPKYIIHDSLISNIYSLFSRFVKSLCWILTTIWWYKGGNIDSGLFLGMLAVHGMPQIMIDLLINCVRVKKTVKTKVDITADTKDTTVDTKDTTVDTKDTTVDATVESKDATEDTKDATDDTKDATVESKDATVDTKANATSTLNDISDLLSSI